MSRVLMIRMKNRGRYFTEESNLDMLHEFAKTFNAELSLVDARDPYLIPMDKLASLVCEQTIEEPARCKVQVVKQIYPEARRERTSLRKNADEIRTFIRQRMVEGSHMSLKILRKKFENLDLTNSCLCNHLTAVREELSQSGFIVEKQGAGYACLQMTA